MKRHETVLTRKGQTTVPAEIRRALGLKEGDRIEWLQQGDQVRLRPGGSVAERTAGMFKAAAPPLSAADLREAAEWAIAGEVAERAGG